MFKKIGLFVLMTYCLISCSSPMPMSQDQFEQQMALAKTKQEQLQVVNKQLALLANRKVELQMLSNYFGREAQRLLFIDFIGSRDKQAMQERTDARIKVIEQQIAVLKAKKTRLDR